MNQRVIRKDNSKGPIMSNTHKLLNKQYKICTDRIKNNELDIETLSIASDDTDSEWLNVIVNEQKVLYRELEYLEDQLAEFNY